MSTTSPATSGPSRTAEPAPVVYGRASGAGLATFVAVVVAVLAVIDLFHFGLGKTVEHLTLALATFGVVRYCIGLALDPPFYEPDNDSPETKP